MADRFTWVPIYREIAQRLLGWQTRQGELIAFLERLRNDGLKITPFGDEDAEGGRLLLSEIDPFTFFGVFNRGIREDNRVAILSAIKKFLDIAAALPEDFEGVPILNNQRSWFVAYSKERRPDDVKRLWEVFRHAQGPSPLDDEDFRNAFDEALNVKGTNVNLTMGLFWIRPDVFLNLDQNNRSFLKITLPKEGLSSEFYTATVKAARSRGSFPELSSQAYSSASQSDTGGQPTTNDVAYWMVGAYWTSQEPPDLTQRFLDDGIWQNGYDNRYLNEVKSMRVGDRIAIKAASTRRDGIPFDAKNHTVSYMQIKAIGTIVANRGDGQTVEVEWDNRFAPKTWYFYTFRGTVWRLRPEDPFAKRLIDFAFNDIPQDYTWFCNEWWGEDSQKAAMTPEVHEELLEAPPYSTADIMASGVFVSEAEINLAMERLKAKQNLILQGPPGTGKTYLARKLAYALIEAKDNRRIRMIQFHQTYAYDDFVRGYRPSQEASGAFSLKDGAFLEFCTTARADPDHRYVFIIDEINRGNVSQILGEVLMLIEGDKRRAEYGMPLTYSRPGEAPFYVPENVYLIGLMNIADRSLAIVDYALRRRFAFFSLHPQYASSSFRAWLTKRNMKPSLVNLIVERMVELNEAIQRDSLLGENFQIGHSFFCPKGDELADYSSLDQEWYRSIISTEILPLLREYWYDNADQFERVRQQLLA